MSLITKMLHPKEKDYRVSPKMFVRDSISRLTEMYRRERYYFEDSTTLSTVESTIGDVLRIVGTQKRVKKAGRKKTQAEKATEHLREAHAILQELDNKMRNRRNWLSALAQQGDTQFKQRTAEAIKHLNHALQAGL